MGAAVDKIRALLEIPKGVLAERVDIDPGYLTKLLNGSRQPSPPVLRRIASALGVSVESISYPNGAAK
ncbi:helix-turn-helix transcriptional regulator [Leucobacter viscericola]|uniref:Helix-turn-helix transcriptional regulator n=1 Tax=Leucobacter viscericola TaxID=2714935 RepID=A0A6G7XHM9_9MICO|nr:helix-turn-helix transcriptional regulator [Leucobacter viscericola]